MLFGDIFEPLLVIVYIAVLNSLLHSKFKLLSKNQALDSGWVSVKVGVWPEVLSKDLICLELHVRI